MNKYVKRFDKLGLKYDKSMKLATDEEIEACYNGCGAEWMPPKLRAKLDDITSIYQDCVIIHDWDFSHSNGTKASFEKANKRFKKNMKIVRDYHFPWSKPSLYRECFKYYLMARALYRAVDLGGWKAWQDAFNAKSMAKALE